MYMLLLSLLLIGVIFTDLPLFPQKTLTHSLMFIIAPSIFVFLFISNNFKISLKSYPVRIFTYYLVASFLVSLLMLLFVSFYLKGYIYAYNKNLFVKLFEAFYSLSLLHFLVLYNFVYIFSKIDLKKIKLISIFTFLFLSMSAVLEYTYPDFIDIFHEVPKIHEVPKNYDRLRLFNLEPSHSGLNYTILSLLSIFFIKKLVFKILFVLIFFTVIFMIASKGLFISIILTIILITFSIFSLKNLKTISFLILSLIVILIVFVSHILPALIIDIEKFTSFSTRLIGSISSLVVLFSFPFGLGYGTYMYIYPEILLKTFNAINDIFLQFTGIQLNPSEIEYMVQTGEAMGAKAAIPQAMMLNGWIAVIFFYMLYRYLSKVIKNMNLQNNQKYLLKFTIILLFIQLFIGSEYTLIYSIWLPIALIERLRMEVNIDET